VIAGRSRGIRPASFYQKWFWTKRHESPAEIHEALHLALICSSLGAMPRYVDEARLAMTHLAIRLAQAGLEKDPDDSLGYLALGHAYDFLSKIEAYAAATARDHPVAGCAICRPWGPSTRSWWETRETALQIWRSSRSIPRPRNPT